MALDDPKPPHQREAYAPIVQRFLPGCEGEELATRCSLLLMRDRALTHSRACSDEAFPVLGQVERLTSTYAYASMRLEQLKELRRLCVMLVANASGLEAFAYDLAYPEEGQGARA